jgi:hypothetical protein
VLDVAAGKVVDNWTRQEWKCEVAAVSTRVGTVLPWVHSVVVRELWAAGHLEPKGSARHLICGKISCLCSYALQYSTVPARFSVAFCSFVKLRFCFLPSSFRVWPHLHENVLSNDDFR